MTQAAIPTTGPFHGLPSTGLLNCGDVVDMGKRKRVPIAEQVKRMLGFEHNADDAEVLRAWKKASTHVCKPCWELKYCPYGPLVEDFPILPPLRADAIEHNDYLKRTLSQGHEADGTPLIPGRQACLLGMMAGFDPLDYPEQIPTEIADMSCSWFGHICPVVFTAEPFTETTKLRRTGRNISLSVLMRVARRDNYMCQICGISLKDDEIEFDHVIPVAKGGSSEEHNLRVTCFACNRKKSANLDILDD